MLLSGAFPVVGKFATNSLPPLFFAAASLLVGGAASLLFCRNSKWGEANPRDAFLLIFFGGILGSALFYIGISQTSAVNASILVQAEILFSLILSYFLLGEKITPKQFFLSFLVLAGALLVLFRGSLFLNAGDLLILAFTFCMSVEAYLAKKLMEKIGVFETIAIKAVPAGCVLLLFSFLAGETQNTSVFALPSILLFIWQGLPGFFFAYFFWFGALKRINLSKATAIMVPYSAIGVVFSAVFLGEAIVWQHIIGLAIISFSVFMLARTNSEKRN